jgi:hypothetical protein
MEDAAPTASRMVVAARRVEERSEFMFIGDSFVSARRTGRGG